jgi:hypothetical protein
MGIPRETPLVKLLEYGFGDRGTAFDPERDIVQAFGLAQSELGIFFEPELAHRAAADTTGRAKELVAIQDETVKQMLIGSRRPTVEDCREYLTRTRLAFGYAHSATYVNFFIDLVLAYEHVLAEGDGGKGRIDIVTKIHFPKTDKRMVAIAPEELGKFEDESAVKAKAAQEAGAKDKSDAQFRAQSAAATLSYQRKLADRHRDALQSVGVGTVVLLTRNTQLVYDLPAHWGGGKRILRLIDPFGLDPQDYNRILVASGELSLATGDQSFSQAISANKLVVYEKYQHKEQLFASWLRLCDSEIGEKSALATFLRMFSPIVSGGGNPLDQEAPDFGKMAKLLSLAIQEGDFAKLNAAVAVKGNAAAGAVRLVRTMAPYQHPSYKALNLLLDSITEAKVRDQRIAEVAAMFG